MAHALLWWACMMFDSRCRTAVATMTFTMLASLSAPVKAEAAPPAVTPSTLTPRTSVAMAECTAPQIVGCEGKEEHASCSDGCTGDACMCISSFCSEVDAGKRSQRSPLECQDHTNLTCGALELYIDACDGSGEGSQCTRRRLDGRADETGHCTKITCLEKDGSDRFVDSDRFMCAPNALSSASEDGSDSGCNVATGRSDLGTLASLPCVAALLAALRRRQRRRR